MTAHPNSTDLDALCEQLLAEARAAGNGRSSRTVVGGAGTQLHQTVLALAAGEELAEHGSPGEATLQVLRGRATLHSGSDALSGGAGTLLAIPDAAHSLMADEDAVVLLTIARRP